MKKRQLLACIIAVSGLIVACKNEAATGADHVEEVYGNGSGATEVALA